MELLSKKLGFKLETHGIRRLVGTAITEVDGIHVAQVVLGHTSIKTTERYVNIQDSKARSAISKLNNLC